MKKLINVLLIFFVACVQTSYAQWDDEKPELIVPDSYYVEKRCNGALDTIERVKSHADLVKLVDMRRIKEVLSTINQLCEKKRVGEISADIWFPKFESYSNVLAELTDPCGRTVACMKMFLSPPQPLPINYEAYSIFLFPSAEWKNEELRDELESIKKAFSSFGDSIGNKNAAIWFAENRYSNIPDIERGKFYCDLINVNYNDGPYIVTSSKRPDHLVEGDEFVLIKLNGISNNRVIKVLNILEQDLRLAKDIRKRRLIFEEIKQRLLSVADRNPELMKEFSSGLISLLTK